jgi:hypothetical protein
MLVGNAAVASDTTDVQTTIRKWVHYPATFSDAENGKSMVYRGSWTMTLQKVSGHWVINGSGSAWTGH